MAWTNLAAAFAYGSKLTSAQMQNLRDNITALANGDAGAPQIQTAAIADDAVTADKISANIGETRRRDLTGGNYQWEVLAANGSWYSTCPVEVTGGS